MPLTPAKGEIESFVLPFYGGNAPFRPKCWPHSNSTFHPSLPPWPPWERSGSHWVLLV